MRFERLASKNELSIRVTYPVAFLQSNLPPGTYKYIQINTNDPPGNVFSFG